MMTRRLLLLLLLETGSALAAQTPADTTDTAETQQLRQELRQRWREHVRTQLNLTPDQAAKLQATEDRFAVQRQEIVRRQLSVQAGLRSQLQPGVAANADSVRRLMDARDQNRAAIAQLERDEDREMSGYLTPVQRARYQFLRQRLQERIAEMRRQRRQQPIGPPVGRFRRRPRP